MPDRRVPRRAAGSSTPCTPWSVKALMSPPTRSTRARDVLRAAPVGALEQQVLEEVADAAQIDSGSSRAPTPTQTPVATDSVPGTRSVATVRPESSCVIRRSVTVQRFGRASRWESAGAISDDDGRRDRHGATRRRHGHGRHGHGRRRSLAALALPPASPPGPRSPSSPASSASNASSNDTTVTGGRRRQHAEAAARRRARPRRSTSPFEPLEPPSPSPPAADHAAVGVRLTLPFSSISSTMTSIS